MSNSNGGGGGRGGSNIELIPAASKRMVESLKEIVNCPEHEIYAMLKECNMDPNDTVHRLLSQDPFHEVKSKKEKKKEMKETSESRPRGFGATSSRGNRGGSSRHDGRGGSTQFIFSESGFSRGKPAYRKENGANDLSSSTSGLPGNNFNRHPISFSDSFAGENKLQTNTADAISSSSSSSQPSPGFQPAWVGVPGQVSMADIVKMGRPRASSTMVMSMETSQSSQNSVALTTSHLSVKHTPVPTPLPLESNPDIGSSQQSASKVSEITYEPGVTGSHHVAHNDWSLVEQASGSGSSILDPTATSEVYADPSIPSNSHAARTKRHISSQSVESQGIKGDVPMENHNANCYGSASASSRPIQDDCSENTSHFDDDSFSYQPHGHALECQEGNDSSSQLSIPNYSGSSVEDATITVVSAAATFQQLSLHEELRAPPAVVNPAVIIPNHLQIPTADCSHLSFGSFGSGLNATFPGSFTSKSLEETSAATNPTSPGQLEIRDPEYFGDEHLRSTSDGDVAPRTGHGSYDSSPSQSEIVKQDMGETTQEHQYSFPSSVPGYTLENTQPNASFSYAQTTSQIPNITPFSSVMQAYTNSLQSNFLASMVQPGRESDLAYAPFAAQSVPTKYSTGMPSVSGPTGSMPEMQVAKAGVLSMPQTVVGTSIGTGPAPPQHLINHYSQATLPMAPFGANLISYPPFVSQSYYMPSHYQQAYAGNNTYHQSAASIKYTVPQQYKSSSLGVPSSYGGGGFGSSSNIPGTFPPNPDDAISSQYKDSNHYVAVQQNDSTVWMQQGPGGSRTVPSTYYNFQGQSQQHNGYRQAQQSSQQQQHYGSLGYPNLYHSQAAAGVSQEHQQQNENESCQVAPSKQSHQMWQHNY